MRRKEVGGPLAAPGKNDNNDHLCNPIWVRNMSDLPAPKSRLAVPSSEQGSSSPEPDEVDDGPLSDDEGEITSEEEEEEDAEGADEEADDDEGGDEDAEGDEDEEMEYISPTDDEDNEDDEDDDDFDPTAAEPTPLDASTATRSSAAVGSKKQRGISTPGGGNDAADLDLDLLGTLDGPANAANGNGNSATGSASGSGVQGRTGKAPLKIKVKLSDAAGRAGAAAAAGASTAKAQPRSRAPSAKVKAASSSSRDRSRSRAPAGGSASQKAGKRKAADPDLSEDELDDDGGDDELQGAGLNDDEEDASDSSEDFSNLDPELSYSRTTVRQMAKQNQSLAATLVELPLKDESRKKQLSEAEQALRKSEMARRRRNQTEKKLEDDKTETINRLLKKQVSRSRSKLGAEGGDGEGGGSGAGEAATAQTASGRRVVGVTREMQAESKRQPRPLFRYISNASGATLSIPMHRSVVGVSQGTAKAAGTYRNAYEQKWDLTFGATKQRPEKRAKIEVVEAKS